MSASIVALIFLIISFVFGVLNNEIKSASLWALWAICVALIAGGLIAGIQ